jgi:hypothetical protein
VAAFVCRTGRRARWRAMGRQLRQLNNFSFVFLLHNKIFNSFAQFLSKFQIVFSIQIIPTKNLFREFKSYRNFSKKFKVSEFI